MMGWLHKINQTQRIWSARSGHYWIMRAVQGHSAHFTAHLEIIVDWSKYLEGTAQSHFKEVATLNFKLCSFAQFAHLLPFLSIYLRPFVASVKLFVFSEPRNIESRDRFLFSSGSIFFPSERQRCPLKPRDLVAARPLLPIWRELHIFRLLTKTSL